MPSIEPAGNVTPNVVAEIQSVKRDLEELRRTLRVVNPSRELKYEVMASFPGLWVPGVSTPFCTPFECTLFQFIAIMGTPDTRHNEPSLHISRNGVNVAGVNLGGGITFGAVDASSFSSGNQTLWRFVLTNHGNGLGADLTLIARFN